MDQPTARPTDKMTATGIGGAVATVVMVVLNVLIPEMEVPMGLEAAIATIVAFTFGYLTPERK